MAGNNRLSYRSLIALEHHMIATHRPSIHPNLTPFALAFHLGASHHRNILCTDPVGGALGQSLHRHFGITQREPRLSTLKAIAFGRGERRARLIALVRIDDAELIPRSEEHTYELQSLM